MNSTNQDYLLEQFRLIEDYLTRLRGLAGRSKADFLNDQIAVDAAIRELTVLFETSHNIAKHIISRNGWRNAASKAEAFEVLSERRVIPSGLAYSFRQASRFRNLVTYQTAIVDNNIVHSILQDRLDDFQSFLSHVARWLKEGHNI